MVDLLLVRIGLVIRFADAFGNNLGIALRMAGVFAVGTLHTGRVFQELSAKSTTHDVVKLLLDKLVTLLFVDLFFLLPDCTLSIQTDVKWPSGSGLLLEAHGQMNATCRF